MRFRLAAVTILAASPTLAGPLDPPPGPITSTMKPLSQVEPRTPIGPATTPGDANSTYRIDKPGSYYLTANLVGQQGEYGIEIAAENVSIDLSGFTLQGVQGSLSGIRTEAGLFGISISGGVVAGWDGAGINILTTNDSRVRDVTVLDCVGAGIMIGWNSLVDSCSVRNSVQQGIYLSGRGAVRNSGVAGVKSGPGFYLGADSTAEACHADGGTDNGFELANRSGATACRAIGNGGHGFNLTDDASLAGCTANGNGGSGIVTAHGARISGCTAQANGAHGISVGAGSLIENNYARQNGLNHASGGGVHLRDVCSRTRVSGNTCVDNDIGIYAQGSYNFIFGNTCSTNDTNYNIAGNNRVGALAVPPLSSPINGNSGGAGVGSTDPWVNLSY